MVLESVNIFFAWIYDVLLAGWQFYQLIFFLLVFFGIEYLILKLYIKLYHFIKDKVYPIIAPYHRRHFGG